MTGLCLHPGPGGLLCQRWDLPTAHWDDSHSSGDVRWPAPMQLVIDITPPLAAGAAPARQEAR